MTYDCFWEPPSHSNPIWAIEEFDARMWGRSGIINWEKPKTVQAVTTNIAQDVSMAFEQAQYALQMSDTI